MNDPNLLVSRWRDLRRHPAFQVAAVYVGASWALIQIADIFFPSLRAIRWMGIALALGFVVVVAIAWRMAAVAARGEASAPSAGSVSPEAASGRRRRRRYTYTAAFGLLLLGGVFWWIRPAIIGAVEPDAQVIAVLPFNTSGASVELLGEGMVDLLSTNLDAVGGIRTVDSRTVLHRWRQRATDGGLDLEGALAVGRDVEAGAVLLGSVIAVGGEVRLTAELYSVRGAVLARGRAGGPADSVLAMVDSLGLDLLREIWLAREPIPNLRVSAITTGSVDAIRPYLLGSQYYRRSRWDSAKAALQKAVAEDSTFALAHYRLALTYGWTTGLGSEGARRHGDAALEYADRLPARERTLVVAHKLFEDGVLAAHDTMRAYVARYPDDPEGWYLLGDVRYHARPILALSLEELYSPFDRVLELDPSLAPAFIHPLELALFFDDSAAAGRYLKAMAAASTAAQVEPYALAASALWGPSDSLDARLDRLAELDPNLLGGVYMALLRSPTASLENIVARFEARAEAALASPNLPPELAGRVAGSAMLLASLGRLAEAKPLFDTLWTLDPRNMGRTAFFLVWAGLADSAYAAGPMQLLAMTQTDPRIEQQLDYGRMLYALSRGRHRDAHRLAAKGLAADSSYDLDMWGGFLTAGLGWADVLAGDTVAGVEKLRSGLGQAGFSRNVLFINSPLRFQLAATLAARPETRAEGLRRLRYGLWLTDTQYAPLSFFVIGQALEESGDRAGAARAYSQFVRLWEKADPELQPRVEAARRALERLAAEGSD